MTTSPIPGAPDDPAFTDPTIRLLWSSFLVRIYRDGTDGIWRGEMLHLQTQEKRGFASLDQIHDFFQTHAPGFLDQHFGVPTNPEPRDGSLEAL